MPGVALVAKSSPVRRKLAISFPQNRASGCLPPLGGTVDHVMFGMLILPGDLSHFLPTPMPGRPLRGGGEEFCTALPVLFKGNEQFQLAQELFWSRLAGRLWIDLGRWLSSLKKSSLGEWNHVSDLIPHTWACLSPNAFHLNGPIVQKEWPHHLLCPKCSLKTERQKSDQRLGFFSEASGKW